MEKLNNFLTCKNDFKAQSRCPTIWFHYFHFLFSMRQSFKETIRTINRAAQYLIKDDIGDYSTLTTLFLCECLRILSVICCIFVSSSRPKRQMKCKIKNKTKQKVSLRYIPIWGFDRSAYFIAGPHSKGNVVIYPSQKFGNHVTVYRASERPSIPTTGMPM